MLIKTKMNTMKWRWENTRIKKREREKIVVSFEIAGGVEGG